MKIIECVDITSKNKGEGNLRTKCPFVYILILSFKLYLKTIREQTQRKNGDIKLKHCKKVQRNYLGMSQSKGLLDLVKKVESFSTPNDYSLYLIGSVKSKPQPLASLPFFFTSILYFFSKKCPLMRHCICLYLCFSFIQLTSHLHYSRSRIFSLPFL